MPRTKIINRLEQGKGLGRLIANSLAKTYLQSHDGGDACDLDDDNDGLSDLDEAIYGTNLLIADTDGDGITNFQEYQRGTDPNVFDKKCIVVINSNNGYNDRPTWMWEVPFMQGAINCQSIHAHKLFRRGSREFEKIPAKRMPE